MSAQEREALIDLLTEVADDQFAGRLRGGYIPETADRLLAAGWSRPVPAAGEAATEDVIERAARVLAQLEPGEEWPSNAALGGNLTGTRDDEYRDAMLDQARDLARAGLLAGGVPGRNEGEIKAEALREFADTRGVNVGDEDDDWWRGYRQAQRECLRDAIAAAARVAGTTEAGGDA